MEARCVAKYLRVAPRKMRLVADLVRGKNVNEAINTLKFTPKAGAKPALKAIQSAVANIVDKDQSREVNPDELVVRTIFVDEGPTFKRFLPRAMGRATPIRKRMSHLTVWVAVPVAPVEAEPEAPVETVAAEEAPKPKPKPARAPQRKTTAASKTKSGTAKKAKKKTE